MIHVNKRSGTESKRKILSAASRVFSEYGYKGASMRMIAKYADISIGGLYLYFRNKEELYATLIGNSLRDLTRETREAVRGIEDAAEALDTFISMRVNYARRHRELILVSGREKGFSFDMKEKKEFFREQRKTVEEIISRGIASGAFRQCNVKEVARIIVCTLRGFILSILVEPDALFSSRECSALILNGLVAGKAGPLAHRRKRSGRVGEKIEPGSGKVNVTGEVHVN